MRKYANQKTKIGRFLARNGGDIFGGFKREFLAKLLTRPWFRSFLSKFYRPREPKKWLFLVGCYNSGTTLLRDILNEHPEIKGLPLEGVRLTGAFEDLEKAEWPRMMYRFRDAWDLPDDGAQEIAAQTKKDWAPWWGRRATVFLEKSIDHSTRIRWLDKHFGTVYFVGIVRNGFCVSEGILRKSKPKGSAIDEIGESYPLEMVAQQWVEFSDRISGDLNAVAHGLQVSYEDLMDKPVKTIEDIINFLELPPMDIALAGKTLVVQGRSFLLENQNAESMARLNDNQKRVLGEIMKPTLIQNGYDL